MIIGTLENAERYYPLHPGFKPLFEFVKGNDFDKLPAGKIYLQGKDVFVNNATIEPKKADNQPLEMHRDYIDVHIALEDGEVFGWKPIEHLSKEGEYNPAKDCALVDDPAEIYVTLKKGDFVIVYPEDPHAPNIGTSTIRKVIGKIRL